MKYKYIWKEKAWAENGTTRDPAVNSHQCQYFLLLCFFFLLKTHSKQYKNGLQNKTTAWSDSRTRHCRLCWAGFAIPVYKRKEKMDSIFKKAAEARQYVKRFTNVHGGKKAQEEAKNAKPKFKVILGMLEMSVPTVAVYV